jgi:hypothetical protein
MLPVIILAMALTNLGTHGQVYPIIEPDMEEQIMTTMKAPDFQDQIAEKLHESFRIDIYIPDTKTRSKRTMSFTYNVPEDLIIDGTVLARKGDVLNLLDTIKIRSKYLFVKDYQMPLFFEMEKKDKNIKAVVISGDLSEIIEQHPDSNIYMGSTSMVDKFAITGVPSLVYQEGREMVIEEIPYVAEGVKDGFHECR